jgi:hypothetical protein
MSELIKVLSAPGAVALIGAITTLCGVMIGQFMSTRSGDKSRIWNQKRDIYAALLGSLNELDMVAGAIARYREMDGTQWVISEIEKLNQQRYSVIREFGRTRELARIFVSSEALKALADLGSAFESDANENEFRKLVCSTVDQVSPRLAAAARKDLGL